MGRNLICTTADVAMHCCTVQSRFPFLCIIHGAQLSLSPGMGRNLICTTADVAMHCSTVQSRFPFLYNYDTRCTTVPFPSVHTHHWERGTDSLHLPPLFYARALRREPPPPPPPPPLSSSSSLLSSSSLPRAANPLALINAAVCTASPSLG